MTADSPRLPDVEVDLSGQVAVVTGAGRGIGATMASALANAGAQVVLVGRCLETLKRTATAMGPQKGEAVPVAVDVVRADQVAKLRTDLNRRWGGIDLLVNNAGILGTPGRWWQRAAEDWWGVLETNLKGTMLCIQAFLPGMLNRGRGRIINLGSNAGVNPVPGLGPYAVSKAALLRLTDSLRTDLAGTGVTVFAISPGLVKTDLSRQLPGYAQIPADLWLPARRSAELCLAIAGGRADALSGGYLHAGEDLETMLASTDPVVK